MKHLIPLERLETLFEAWSSLPVEQRQAFLAELSPEERTALEPLVEVAPEAQAWFARTLTELHPPPVDVLPHRHERGKFVAHFRLSKLIRQGSLSSVHVAMDILSGREVALKLIDLRTIHNYKEYFRESRIVARLEHTNICSILSSGITDDDIGYMEMPLYKGHVLRDVMENGPMAHDVILDVLRQVSSGLEAAHSEGVIHRDIKPENLFMRDGGNIRILDFGIARLISRVPSTAAGVLKGTIPYVSPECITDPPAGPPADFWSLGVMAYEMASGKQPFRGSSVVQIMNNILKTEPDPIPGLPPSLDAFLSRSLVKDPGRRIASAREVRQLLG